MEKSQRESGSFLGLIISLIIGFSIYFILVNINNISDWLTHDVIIANAADNFFYKLMWYITDFTEPQFYVGVCASIGIILGGFIAWRLDLRDSKYAGFNISYGSNLWPWVLASQVITLFLTVFVLNFTRFFENGEYTWLPTFIMVVGAPPSIMLLYGPSLINLFTVSIISAFLGFPTAFWIMNNLIPIWEVPGVVSNVFTMALTGIIVAAIMKWLPWVKKVSAKSIGRHEVPADDLNKQMRKPAWFVRRVFADFSEAQFYGNEIAGAFVILGAMLDWILNINHGAYGSGLIPAIILSQIISSAVGVYLYFNMYLMDGWSATYVPVVSVAPACVLMFGGSMYVILLAGILGGILGAPLAAFFTGFLPDGFHGTIANVTSMGVSTIIVSMVIKALI